MQYILGAYSQIPSFALEKDYTDLLEKQLKPLFTLLYKNSHLHFLLSLGQNCYEWIEVNYPEINMLIADLVRKGQLELLSNSVNSSILSLIPVNDRSKYIEETTVYIRKRFGKRPSGYFSNFQIFNPSTISAISMGMLKYMVISPFNQLSGKIEATKPFYMSEFNSNIYVFPTDDFFSKAVFEFYKADIATEVFFQNISKHVESLPNSFRTIMINLDQIAGKTDSVNIFSLLFSSLRGESTTPGIYLKEKEVGKIYYLPASIYGRDFELKSSSVNQMIIQNGLSCKNMLTLRFLREEVKKIKKSNPIKKQAEYLIERADYGAGYIDSQYRNMDILTYSGRQMCALEQLLIENSVNKFPLAAHIADPLFESSILYTDDSIAYINNRGAVVDRISFFNINTDLSFCDDGLFLDSLRQKLTDRPLFFANKKFESSFVGKSRTDAVFLLKQIELNKNALSIKKSYKLEKNAIRLDVEIQNTKDNDIRSLIYEMKLSVNLLNFRDIKEINVEKNGLCALGAEEQADVSVHSSNTENSETCTDTVNYVKKNAIVSSVESYGKFAGVTDKTSDNVSSFPDIFKNIGKSGSVDVSVYEDASLDDTGTLFDTGYDGVIDNEDGLNRTDNLKEMKDAKPAADKKEYLKDLNSSETEALSERLLLDAEFTAYNVSFGFSGTEGDLLIGTSKECIISVKEIADSFDRYKEHQITFTHYLTIKSRGFEKLSFLVKIG